MAAPKHDPPASHTHRPHAPKALSSPCPPTPPPPPPPPARKAKKAPRNGAIPFILAHQLELSLAFLLAVLLGNAVSRPRYVLDTRLTPDPSWHIENRVARFLFLSFKKPGEEALYFKGRDDAYLIAFWFLLFFFLREACMRWLWEPIARCAGIQDKRSVVRLAEQGWTLTYEIVFASLGMYIMQTSPYRNLRTEYFYIGYPHDALPPLSKWYYLVQTAFWLQQIVVLNLEERRKDHIQMLTHHAVTVLLMTFSYVLNWTRVGNAVLCVMDFADILLPLAKLFVYTKRPKLADATFGVFLFAWVLTRHVLFGRILYSVAFELPRLVPYAWHPRDGYFNARWSHMGFTGLLAALQVMLLLWLRMILKVAWQVMMGHPGEDTRSEAGDSDQEDEEEDEPVIVEDLVDPRAPAPPELEVDTETKKDR